MLNFKKLKTLISQISEIRGLSEDEVDSALLEALAVAYKKDSNLKDAKVVGKKFGETVKFYLVKEVIDPQDVENGNIKFNPSKHILLSEAQNIKSDVQVGEEIYLELPQKEEFSRIAAQTARQVITQRLREIEKKTLLNELKEKEGKVVSGVIERKDSRGNVYVNLGKVLGVMYKNETIPGENYRVGQRMRFYVYEVLSTPKGVEVYLSRAHPLFVPTIFSIEVPEIVDGLVEIKGVARDPGIRTKMAVYSKAPNIDPVGACIGAKGARIYSVMNELNGEKIDIVLWDEDPAKFVANALSPAKVVEVKILPKRTMLVLVPAEDLPLAIGKNGQNIKLAARLAGWKIDVRSASSPEEAVEYGLAEPESELTEPEAEQKENGN